MRTIIAALCSILAAVTLAANVARASDEKKAEEKPAAADKADKADKKEAADAKEAPAADEKSGPEKMVLDKTGKMAPVTFPHRKHQEKAACKDCHEGEKPLFEQKRNEKGYLMKEMYAGGTCGKCHDGKKAFKAQGGCMKCHKKEK
ncbi:MAG: hypothetical protein HY553_07570 [Elusimicrobia bacterium]|nr:hypothetical protein [Elusimicrobiota bacterium]